MARSVLDLGCGTGALATELADGRDAVGVDPAAAMLEIARARNTSGAVLWVKGSATSIRLGRRFDLIILTGHAFQVFLTEDEQLAVLNTIANHPLNRADASYSTPAILLSRPQGTLKEGDATAARAPEHGPVDKWNESKFDEKSGVQTYSNTYRIIKTGEVKSGVDRIRYTSKAELDGCSPRRAST